MNERPELGGEKPVLNVAFWVMPAAKLPGRSRPYADIRWEVASCALPSTDTARHLWTEH